MSVFDRTTLDRDMATYKDARRYGTILTDCEYDTDCGPLVGAHRIITINHKELDFTFHLHNGEVIDVIIIESYKES